MDDTFSKTRLRQGQATPTPASAATHVHTEEEQFLLTIFRPWFTRFHSQCLQMTTHPFYRAVCMLIDFFTKEEQ